MTCAGSPRINRQERCRGRGMGGRVRVLDSNVPLLLSSYGVLGKLVALSTPI